MTDIADIQQRINALATKQANAQNEKIRCETELEQVNKEAEALKAECLELGIEPKDLPAKIESLSKEITTLVETAEQTLVQANDVESVAIPMEL